MLLLLSLSHYCNITVEYNHIFLFGGIKMNDSRIFGFYGYAYISKQCRPMQSVVKNLVLGSRGSHQAHFRVAFTSEQSGAADCSPWRT